LIVLIVAAVVAVIFLVRLLIQLRTTAEEAELTLGEVRVLVRHLSELDLEIKAQVEDLGGTLGVSKTAAVEISKAAALVTSKFLPAPLRYLPFVLLAARYILRQIKTGKEKHHVE
jgi:predicted secreted protein